MRGGMILDQVPTPIDELSAKLHSPWPRITAARDAARDKFAEIEQALAGETSPDTCLVVFGSLAREEFTQASDLDWTLLVDGQASPQHQNDLLAIKDKLSSFAKTPGRERTFGRLTFSHQVLHLIGGEDDTNANTTRRVLFLLEASPVGEHREVFVRVRKNILHRYLSEDHGLTRKAGAGEVRWTPLFLLNDMARYWRTMTVDFAYKQRDRGNDGYALRSLKLGISRKLIYASGLLSCFWCDPAICKEGRSEVSEAEKIHVLNQRLNKMLLLTPLDRFARFFLTHAGERHLIASAATFFVTYDEFLAILEDPVQRSHLDRLSPDKMDEDELFQRARAVRTRFEEAIKGIFLHSDSPLYQHTISRGVF